MKKIFFLLTMMLASVSSWATTGWTAGDGVSYYLYNVESGMFLKGSNNWGTKAALASEGETFTLEASDANVIIKATRKGNGLFIDSATGLFVDMGQQNRNFKWEITKNEDGTCYIRIAADDATYGSASKYGQAYLGCNMGYVGGTSGDYNLCPIGVKKANTAAITWMILTEEEYTKMRDVVNDAQGVRKTAWPYVRSAIKTNFSNKQFLNTILNPASTASEINEALTYLQMQLMNERASATSPIDYTYMLTNADATDGSNGWTMEEGNNNYNPQGGDDTNNNAESWRSVFDLHQTVASLPNGTYGITVQAALTDYTEAYDGNGYAVLYSGEETTPFNAMEGSDRGSSMGQMSGAFSSGAYYTSPIYVDVTDNTLTFGVKNDRTNTWCIWDNFELTYYGSQTSAADLKLASYITELDNLKAEAAAITSKMGATEAEALAAVADITPAEKTVEAYEVAIAAAKEAINNAKSSITNYYNAANYAEIFKADAKVANVDIKAEELDAAYDAGTLDFSKGNPYSTAYYAAVKAATESGTGVEGAILNPSFETNGTESWTLTNHGGSATNKNFGMLTGDIFVERWTAGPGTLNDGQMSQNVTLPAGVYVLTAEAQNLQQGNASVIPVGFKLFAGDAEATITNIAGTYAVEFTVYEEGEVSLGSKIAGCTGNWVSIDNFQLYKVGEAPELLPAMPEIAAPVSTKAHYDYVAITKNRDLDSSDMSSYHVQGAAKPVMETAKCKQNGTAIKVIGGAKVDAAWDTQFFIVFDEPAQAGDVIRVQFDYMADTAAKGSTQAHGNPGNYSHWAAIGDVNFTGEWKIWDQDFTVTSDMTKNDGGMKSIAFNLNELADANNYYFGKVACYKLTQTEDIDPDEIPAMKELPEVEEGFDWIPVTTNGDFTEDDLSSYYAQGAGVTKEVIEAPKGESILKVVSGNMAEDGKPWDSQFFIVADQPIPSGTKYFLSFDYKAKDEATVSLQSHATPGSYLGGFNPGSILCKTDEWQNCTVEGTSTNDKFQSVAFNLNELATSTEYYIANVQFYILKDLNVEVTMKVGAGTYATFFAPFDLERPENVKVYATDAVEENGTTLVLQEYEDDKLSAGMAVILYSDEAVEKTYKDIPYEGLTYDWGWLIGVDKDTEAPEGSYVLQNHGGDVAFWQVQQNTAKPIVPAFHCYLQPEGDDVKAFTFGNTTAISTINALLNNKAEIYDINGRKLNKLQKGVNVVNGKKVLVK